TGYQKQQVQLIKNYAAEVRPSKSRTGDLDALIYMILTEEDVDNQEMREFLYRDRNELSVYSKAMFGLALDTVGDKKKLEMVLQNIDQFVVQDAENETAYVKNPNRGYWYYWYGSEIEANAYYLKLLARTDPNGVKAPRLVKYLLNNRKHATYWNSTRDTALCIEAFSDYIKASGENKPEMIVEVLVDGKLKKEVQINAGNLFTFDNQFLMEGADLTAGNHEIEIRRKGKGPVYWNTYLTNFSTEDYITEAGLEVKVNRRFYRLTSVDKKIKVQGSRGQAVNQKVEKYERTELEDLSTVSSGDLIEVELTVVSKNDYEYLQFEDFKPAGFEAVNVRSGYTNTGLRAYTEFRDDRVNFFVRKLARGNHSVSYRLRAEVPGRFSALPARVAAMYAPELEGNSNEIKLNVVDSE
ncbi:MAG: alpha-2-macroglobulin, partial [Alphaproteobacteria bacterium]|nr:alpha-2-macroglobulin [Alphaproteobacteria bacterium]